MGEIKIPSETRFYELQDAIRNAYARHGSFEPGLAKDVLMLLAHGVVSDCYELPKGVVCKEARRIVKELNAAITSWARFSEPDGKLPEGDRALAFAALIGELGKRLGDYAVKRAYEKLEASPQKKRA
jgi:hypothetical protein